MKWSELNASYQIAHLLDTDLDRKVSETYNKYLGRFRALKAKERTPDEETAYRILDNALFGQDDESDEMNGYLSDDVPGLEDVDYDRSAAIYRLKDKTDIGSPTVAGLKAGAVELGSRTLDMALDILNLLSIPQSAITGIAREQVANDSVAGKAGGAVRGATVGALLPILNLLDNFNPTDHKLTNMATDVTGAPKTDSGSYLPSQVYKDITGDDTGLGLGLAMDVLLDPILLEGAISKLRASKQLINGGKIVSRLRKAEAILESAKVAKLDELRKVTDPLYRELDLAKQALTDAEKAHDYRAIEEATNRIKDTQSQLEKALRPAKEIEARQAKLKETTDRLTKELDAKPSAERTSDLSKSTEDIRNQSEDLTKANLEVTPMPDVSPTLGKAISDITEEAGRQANKVDKAADLVSHPVDSIGKSMEDALHYLNTAGDSAANPQKLPGLILKETKRGLTAIPKVIELLPAYKSDTERKVAEEISRAYERGKQLSGKSDDLQAITSKIDDIDKKIASAEAADRSYGITNEQVRIGDGIEANPAATANKALSELQAQRQALVEQYDKINDPIYREVIDEFRTKYPELSENSISRAIAITDERTVAYIKAAQQRLTEMRDRLHTADQTGFISRITKLLTEPREIVRAITAKYSQPDLFGNGTADIDSQAIKDTIKDILDAFESILGDQISAPTKAKFKDLNNAIEALKYIGDKDFAKMTQPHLDSLRKITANFDQAAKSLRTERLNKAVATVTKLAQQNPDSVELSNLHDGLKDLQELVRILKDPISGPASKFPQGLLHLKNDEKIATFITLSKMELPSPFHPLSDPPRNVRKVHMVIPTDDGLIVYKNVSRDALDKGEGIWHAPSAPTGKETTEAAKYLSSGDKGEAVSIGWWIEATPTNTKTIDYMVKLSDNLYKAEAGLFNSTVGIGKMMNRVDAFLVKLALSPAATYAWAQLHKIGLPKFVAFTGYHTQNLVGNLLNAFGNEQVMNHPILFIKALGKWIIKTDQAAKALKMLDEGKVIADLPTELQEAYRDFLRMGSQIGSGINRTLKDAITRTADEVKQALGQKEGLLTKGINASVEIGAIQDFVFRAAVREVAGPKAAYKTLGHMSARTPLEINTQTFLKFLPWIRYNAHFWLDKMASNPAYARTWINLSHQLRREQQGALESGAVDAGDSRIDIGRMITAGNIADPTKVVTSPIEGAMNTIGNSAREAGLPYTGIVTTAISAAQRIKQQMTGKKTSIPAKVLKSIVALTRTIRPINDLVKAFVDPAIDGDVDTFMRELAKQVSGLPINAQGQTMYFVIKALETSDKAKYRDVIRQLKQQYREQLRDFEQNSDVYKWLNEADKDLQKTYSKDIVSPNLMTSKAKTKET